MLGDRTSANTILLERIHSYLFVRHFRSTSTAFCSVWAPQIFVVPRSRESEVLVQHEVGPMV